MLHRILAFRGFKVVREDIYKVPENDDQNYNFKTYTMIREPKPLS